MNVQELIDELKSQDVVLSYHGYRLRWDVPTGCKPTEEIKEAVKEHWNEIIKRVDGNIPYWVPKGRGTVKLTQQDCMKVMDLLPANLVDLIVTDPPYGYEFMGKDWDKAVPSVQIWKECLRVLKPGGFAFIMSAPRQDVLARMIVNLQDAGFKTGFTSLYWTYARGFPKAYNISKAIDKKTGVELENLKGSYAGYQPKPAIEVILIAQKPMSENTYVDQALTNEKGITWLDDCRIPCGDEAVWSADGGVQWSPGKEWNQDTKRTGSDAGRFPANLLVGDNVLDEAKTHEGGYSKFFSHDAWVDQNIDGLHIDALEEVDQKVIPFLIVPKASKKERDFGLENLDPIVTNDGRKKAIDNPFQRGKTERLNHHPTVKPILLMSYLIKMGSREGDLVLDPFCGTGTTCMAARLMKRPSIGIERDSDYIKIAQARIRALVHRTWGEESKSEPETGEK